MQIDIPERDRHVHTSIHTYIARIDSSATNRVSLNEQHTAALSNKNSATIVHQAAGELL